MQNEINTAAAVSTETTETTGNPVAPATVKPEPATAATPKAASKPRKPRKPKASAKPGKAKAAPPAKAEPEAKPDKHAQRAKAAELYRAIDAAGRVKSIPVKPLASGDFEPARCHPSSRNPSYRQSAAICVAFAAAGTKLATGASAPRVFDFDGGKYFIENGALSDAIAAGLVTFTGSGHGEKIKLLKNATETITGFIGETILKKAGIA